MLISTKNKKSSIIKSIALLLACLMLMAFVLSGCDAADALDAATQAQSAAEIAGNAAKNAQTAADEAAKSAQQALANAKTAQDTADAATTVDDVAKAIKDALGAYTTTSKLPEAIGAFVETDAFKNAVKALIDQKSFQTAADVKAAIDTATAAATKQIEDTYAKDAALQALATKLADGYYTNTQTMEAINTKIAEAITPFVAYQTENESDKDEIEAELATAVANFTTKLGEYATIELVDQKVAAALAECAGKYKTQADIEAYVAAQITALGLEAKFGNYYSKAEVDALVALKTQDYMAKTEVIKAITDAVEEAKALYTTTEEIKKYVKDEIAAIDLGAAGHTDEEINILINALVDAHIDEFDAVTPMVVDFLKKINSNRLILTNGVGVYYSVATVDAAMAKFDTITIYAFRAQTVDSINKLADDVDDIMAGITTVIDDAFIKVVKDDIIAIDAIPGITAGSPECPAFIAAVEDAIAKYRAIIDPETGVAATVEYINRVIPKEILDKYAAALEKYKELGGVVEEGKDFKADIEKLISDNALVAPLNKNILYSLYKLDDVVVEGVAAPGADGAAKVLYDKIITWAASVMIDKANISNFISNFADLEAIYNKAEGAYKGMYRPFVDTVKPLLDAALASDVVLYTDAKFDSTTGITTKTPVFEENVFEKARIAVDAWLYNADAVNAAALYTKGAEFTKCLNRINALRAAEVAAATINAEIHAFYGNVTEETAQLLIAIRDGKINSVWCATHLIPIPGADGYLEENYRYIVNMEELESYIAESRALIADFIESGKEFVRIVKSTDGYNSTPRKATLFSGEALKNALIKYDEWSNLANTKNLKIYLDKDDADSIGVHYEIMITLRESYYDPAGIPATAIGKVNPLDAKIDAVIANLGIYSAKDVDEVTAEFAQWISDYAPEGYEIIRTVDGIEYNYMMDTTLSAKLDVMKEKLAQLNKDFDAIEAAKNAKTKAVIDAIAEIGKVTVHASDAKIANARNLYDEWATDINFAEPDPKTYVVTNYQVLLDAEAKQAQIIAAHDKALADINALEALGLTATDVETATSAVYKAAIELAKASVAAFDAEDLNDGDVAIEGVRYLPDERRAVIDAAQKAFDQYDFDTRKANYIARLRAIELAEAAKYDAVTDALLISKLETSLATQIERVELIDLYTYEPETHSGRGIYEELDRLVENEFQTLLDTIVLTYFG